MNGTFTPAGVGNCTYKLISAKGTLLGHITIPPAMDEILKARWRLEFMLAPAPPKYWESNQAPFIPRRATIEMEPAFSEWAGGVRLWGVSIEEFEVIPGCAFYPGAAYLRSVIE